MKGIILRKGNQYYTYLNPIFDAIGGKQREYNWLIAEVGEWHDIFLRYECICCDEYIWITGAELTKLIKENQDVQMIWGVLLGFKTKYSLEQILQYPLPFADMNSALWKNPITMQNPLASMEIVAFDSSCTLIKCEDEKILERINNAFPLCEDLEKYNAGDSDDSIAYEKWLSEK